MSPASTGAFHPAWTGGYQTKKQLNSLLAGEIQHRSMAQDYSRATPQADCYNGVEVSLRDELKSIEIVPVRYANIVLDHQLLKRDRLADWAEIRLQRRVVRVWAAIYLVGGFAMLIPDPDEIWPLIVALALSGLTLLCCAWLIAQKNAKFLKARMLKPIVWKDIEARVGPILFSNEYVGVSFSSDCWIVAGSPIVDLGALSVDFDRIRFAGRKIDFELPGARVENVDVVRADVSQKGPYMPARIAWRHPDGSLQYVCIQPRDSQNARGLYRDVVDLRNRIEALREGPHLPESDEALLPPKSTGLPLNEHHMHHQTQLALWSNLAISTSSASMMFVLAQLATFQVTKLAGSVINREFGWQFPEISLSCGLMLWLLGMAWMRRRTQRRLWDQST